MSEDVSQRSGGGAKIMMILSPAKTLDLSSFSRSMTTTRPGSCGDPTKTRAIATAMKAKSESELTKLLCISKALAVASSQYWNDFEMDQEADTTGKPCVFCFSGAAFQGLNALTCTDEEFQYLQESLRIVDPLYGLLRPMDVIQPYRLEMLTKGLRLNNSVVKLADYWKPTVTKSLLNDLGEGDDFENNVLLNLASDEYSAAVDQSQFGTRFVKVIFREQGRVVSVHAKRARGLMARYAAKTQASTLDEIRQFQEEGYKLVASESNISTLVFDRNKNWKSETKPKSAEKRDMASNESPKGETETSKRKRTRSSKT